MQAAVMLLAVLTVLALFPAEPQASVPQATGAAQAPDAEALWLAGQRQAALELLEAELAARPDDGALRLRLAERLAQVSRWQATLDTLAPLGAEAGPLRGSSFYMLSRFEEALPLLSAEDPLQSVMRVDALLALGRTEEARAALAEAARARGGQEAALDTLRGRLLAADGAYSEAVPAFRAALARDPLDRAALFGLGQALLRTGAREEGLALLERHRALLPLLDRRDFALQSLGLDELAAGNHAQVGDIERELQLLDSAEQRYRRAEELARPEELTAIVLRHARLLAEDRKDPDAAVALLDGTGARAPDVRLAVRAADVLVAAGRPAEAVARYEKVLASRPDDAPLAERLRAARAAAEARDP